MGEVAGWALTTFADVDGPIGIVGVCGGGKRESDYPGSAKFDLCQFGN